jgi:ribosome-binding factor A
VRATPFQPFISQVYVLSKHPPSPRAESRREASPRAPGFRGQRLEELFREELNSLLEVEVNDPALDGARITRVELSGDGSSARVWFSAGSALASALQVGSAFERAAGFLRSRLSDALPLKRTPELRFRHDPAALAAPEPQEEP